MNKNLFLYRINNVCNLFSKVLFCSAIYYSKNAYKNGNIFLILFHSLQFTVFFSLSKQTWNTFYAIPNTDDGLLPIHFYENCIMQTPRETNAKWFYLFWNMGAYRRYTQYCRLINTCLLCDSSFYLLFQILEVSGDRAFQIILYIL